MSHIMSPLFVSLLPYVSNPGYNTANKVNNDVNKVCRGRWKECYNSQYIIFMQNAIGAILKFAEYFGSAGSFGNVRSIKVNKPWFDN